MRKDQELCSRKSNELIQNCVWHCTEAELKIFELLCCCYNTEYYNAETNTIHIAMKDIAKECELPSACNSGTYYNRIIEILKKLSDRSAIIDNKKQTRVIRILSEANWNKESGKLVVYMTNTYKEEMSKFPNGYAFVELKIINGMTSKYSINLYNLIRSWSGEKSITLDIDYLRNKMQVPQSSFQNVGKFKQILDKCVAEINNLVYSYNGIDERVSYEIHKSGKKYSDVTIFLGNAITLDNISLNWDYSKTPLEILFENEEEREQYIDEWINYHFGNGPGKDKYELLFSSVPEQVHKYLQKNIDAIYNIALDYCNLISPTTIYDKNIQVVNTISKFNIRKWNNNYENKVEKDITAYYIKSFECWCEQQRKFKLG